MKLIETEIKVVKTITNQYIIGKVVETETEIQITKPYMVIPDPNGIQLFPYDQAIIGKLLDEMVLSKTSTMYCTEPGGELKNTYVTAISGITAEPKKEIII